MCIASQRWDVLWVCFLSATYKLETQMKVINIINKKVEPNNLYRCFFGDAPDKAFMAKGTMNIQLKDSKGRIFKQFRFKMSGDAYQWIEIDLTPEQFVRFINFDWQFVAKEYFRGQDKISEAFEDLSEL